MRPTGRLHIGHYFGALQNWIKLQNDPQYECFFFIADWHAMTSDYADTSQVAQNTIEIATDWLASGLDPAKCTMFIQSSVPEHAELSLLLSMVTPLGWLERVPTYKEALDNVKDKDLHTYGFLGYPVLQSADIVIYDADFVPVGEDQVAHVELTREIVRRFDFFYGFKIKPELFAAANMGFLSRYAHDAKLLPLNGSHFTEEQKRDLENLFRTKALDQGVENFLDSVKDYGHFFSRSAILREPGAMLTETPRIPGTDGRKMSKSYGNFIPLSESNDSIRAKSRVMMTDPARKRRTDPGNPDVCPVYDWHKLFSPPEMLAWAAQGCRTAGIGCIECKTAMADNLIKWIEPIRARREEYAAHPDNVLRVLDDGSAKAHVVAQKTMGRVREAVFNWKEKRGEFAQQKSSAQNAKVGD
ncbi:MAG: tryptophan--tRNA ligase [Acidobacteriia bacterium]|nr:tryptophan--tRNA ligase [Terriglobia bacterium]